MRHLKLFSFFLIVYLSTFNSAFAEHNGSEGHDHNSKIRVEESVDSSNIKVLPNEAVIVVHGIVCSFCSQGVTRSLSKLSFIDPSKYTKGVKVEIEDQKVTIAIKPDQTLDLEQVFSSITKGGYEPVEAYVSDADGNMSTTKAPE